MPNYPSLNFDLGETVDILRETVADFANREIAPRAADIDRTNEFPRAMWPQLGPSSPALRRAESPTRY